MFPFQTFSGHLHVDAAKKRGNPSYDRRNLNQLPFTVDLRDTLTLTGAVLDRSQREDAVSNIIDSSLEGAAAYSGNSSHAATPMNRLAPQERAVFSSPASGGWQETASTHNRHLEVRAAPRHTDRTAASSTLEETSASAFK